MALLSWSYQPILNFVGLVWSPYFRKFMTLSTTEKVTQEGAVLEKYMKVVLVTTWNLNKMLATVSKYKELDFFFLFFKIFSTIINPSTKYLIFSTFACLLGQIRSSLTFEV